MSSDSLGASVAVRKKDALLSRERIIATALALADREGADALSMRKLGAELGVDPMAVYYHIPNKEALLDAIVEAVMSEIDLSLDDPSAAPEERVLIAALAYRDALLAHAKALPIVLSRGPSTPAAMRPVELLMGIFRQAGLPPDRAAAAMNAIAGLVRGLASMGGGESVEPPTPEALAGFAARFDPAEFPHLFEAMGTPPDFMGADFEFGVRALARGLLAGSDADA